MKQKKTTIVINLCCIYINKLKSVLNSNDSLNRKTKHNQNAIVNLKPLLKRLNIISKEENVKKF